MNEQERKDFIETLESDLDYTGFNPTYGTHEVFSQRMTDEELISLSNMVSDYVRLGIKIVDQI